MNRLPLFLFLSMLSAISFKAFCQPIMKESQDSYSSETKPVMPLEEIGDFVEVFNKIKSDYVETLDDSQIMKKALHGMTIRLDPHSAFLDKENYSNLKESTSGKFGGIGIEIGAKGGKVMIISPIDGSPAEKAGLLAGDIITKVNNSPIDDLGIENISQKIKGPPGSKVTLTVDRKGENKPLRFKISRSLISNESVTIERLPSDIFYLRISQFQRNTGKELKKKLSALLGKNSTDPKGVILDLRNNPGGILNSAVEVCNAFLEKGIIVSTKGRQTGSNQKFFASGKVLIKNAPLIVLINEGSASASEIVAGALKDNNRAIIAGRQSFGKGSVQTIHPMRNDTALKLTTAFYYTPDGLSIQATGIRPDIVIENLTLDTKEETRFTETDLNQHIKSKVKTQTEVIDFDFLQLAKNDFELYQAIKILKVIMMTIQ